VRTFCTNEHGFVVKERYEGFIGTNGHSLKSRRSDNTNFAFLVRTELTEPLEDTTRYGKSVSKLATTIGGGNPFCKEWEIYAADSARPGVGYDEIPSKTPRGCHARRHLNGNATPDRDGHH